MKTKHHLRIRKPPGDENGARKTDGTMQLLYGQIKGHDYLGEYVYTK